MFWENLSEVISSDNIVARATGTHKSLHPKVVILLGCHEMFRLALRNSVRTLDIHKQLFYCTFALIVEVVQTYVYNGLWVTLCEGTANWEETQDVMEGLHILFGLGTLFDSSGSA